jgi:hypothetical protein
MSNLDTAERPLNTAFNVICLKAIGALVAWVGVGWGTVHPAQYVV